MSIFNLLLWLVSLSVITCIHEYGHYLAMKRNGVKVLAVSLGFGSWTIWQKVLANGTILKFTPILLGGYTQPQFNGEGGMASKSTWQKTKIYLAGPLTNFVAASGVLAAVYYLDGDMSLMAQSFSHWAPNFLRPLVSGVAVIGYLGTHPLQLMQTMSGLSHLAPDASTSAMIVFAAKKFAILNVLIAVFNLLPIAHLDGAAILATWLDRLGMKRLARQLPRLSIILVLIIFLLVTYANSRR